MTFKPDRNYTYPFLFLSLLLVILIAVPSNATAYTNLGTSILANQTILPNEVLFVDGGSIDKTKELIKKKAKQYSWDWYTGVSQKFWKYFGIFKTDAPAQPAVWNVFWTLPL